MNETAAAEFADRSENRPIEASYKAPEVEGALDLLFYRRLGFRCAQFFAVRRISPGQVTLLATICGVTAGHLYVYQALWLNVFGMLLHVTANLFDNADGQLARITHQQSERGRVLDGIGDNLVFVSVYVHLCFRFVHGGGSNLIWLIAIAAGICHSFQSAAAEFCRDAYLRFATDRRGELFSSREIRLRERESHGATAKLLLALHGVYTAQQELALPQLAKLRDSVTKVPDWFRSAYRESHRALVRHARLLGTNARMVIIFIALFLARPTWYFIADLTAFNALFLWLTIRENSLASHLRTEIQRRGAD